MFNGTMEGSVNDSVMQIGQISAIASGAVSLLCAIGYCVFKNRRESYRVGEATLNSDRAATPGGQSTRDGSGLNSIVGISPSVDAPPPVSAWDR